MEHRPEKCSAKKEYIVKIKKTAALLLVCVLLFTVSACKPSPAIRDYVYDNTADHIRNTEEHELDNDRNNDTPDENIPPKDISNEAQSERGRERENPVYSDSGSSNEKEAPAPASSQNATENKRQSTREADAGVRQSGGAASEGNGTARPGNSSQTGTGEGNGSGQQTENGGTGTLRQIVDADGRHVEIPQNVKSLTAVGNAAVIVEMLGGDSKLAGTSASLGQGISADVFKSSAEQLWDYSGQSPLSDEKFSRLLSLKPEVCLEISGQTTFSDAQLKQLDAAGIKYVVLPPMNTMDSVCQAVDLAAQIIGGNDAADKSKSFRNFCSGVSSFVSDKTSMYNPDGINFETGSTDSAVSKTDGKISLYISAWDASAQYTLHNDQNIALSGSGMAVVQTGYEGHPVVAFLERAGVINSSSLEENNYSLKETSVRYVNPIVNNLYAFSVSGGTTGARYNKRYVYTASSEGNLGTDAFNSIIVPDSATAGYIRNDGLWKSYDYTSSASGHSSGYGFLDGSGNLVDTTIRGRYNICVMPAGVSNWNSGGPESILIPVWALWKVRGLIDSSAAEKYISDFYSEFYGHSLSSSEMKQILGE